jgi:3-demethoxyubiquinol 3-hydroxylase
MTEAATLPASRTPPSARARAAMIRVNQAGEYGARRIYEGQLAILGDRGPGAKEIAHMAEQEAAHLDWFNAEMTRRGVRPTLLHPLWHGAGYALGAVTAALGPEAAMACTAAVETEIDRHYTQQLEELGDSDPELSAAIRRFQADEIDHRDAALAAGAERTPGYPILSAIIRAGCRAAIAVAKRI